jgi:integrase
MRGSVLKPGGTRKTWRIRWEGKPDPVTGLRRQHHKAGFRTGREAEAELRYILGEIDRGTFVAPTRRRLGDYLREWLEGLDLAPNTTADYHMLVESRIIPVLGNRRIDEVTPEVLDEFYRRLLLEGGRNRQGLSRRSVRLVHTILRKAFADGVKRGTLATNPVARATPPKQARREFHTWSANELRRFLEAAQEHRLYPALFVAATTGMRRSEILGLRWGDVDLEAGRASVQQRLVLVDSKPTVLTGPSARAAVA